MNPKVSKGGDRADEATAVAKFAVDAGALSEYDAQKALRARYNGTTLSDMLARLGHDTETVEAVMRVETLYREGRTGELALDVLDRCTAKSLEEATKLSVAIAAQRASKRLKGERTDVFLLPGFAKA